MKILCVFVAKLKMCSSMCFGFLVKDAFYFFIKSHFSEFLFLEFGT